MLLLYFNTSSYLGKEDILGILSCVISCCVANVVQNVLVRSACLDFGFGGMIHTCRLENITCFDFYLYFSCDCDPDF